MNRRRFLKTAGAVPLTLLPLGRSGWAARLPEGDNRKRLVVVLLRGAVDGLNVVIPYRESVYYDARPNIAVPERGDGALLDLDGRFGLHPALASLLPFWKEQKLSFVHACGSPDPTRSHFDAQDYMESGTPGRKSTSDGWMNRLLAILRDRNASAAGASFGPTLPRIFDGKLPVTTIAVGKQMGKPMAIDRPQVSNAFDRMYQGGDPLSAAYREGQAARRHVLTLLEQDMEQSNRDAPSALGFTGIAEQAGRLLARDPTMRLAFLAVGGWDTHINQGAANGQLANHLRPLGDGLATLARALGNQLNDTAVVVMSEFGRTVRENGNGGTDHGHGNVIWLLGAARGGKVYGTWPGLSSENLYEGRDLPVTTDFRDVLGALLARHMDMRKEDLPVVFPGFIANPARSGALG
jgi:uncharacterized protein (DUF1501 family)